MINEDVPIIFSDVMVLLPDAPAKPTTTSNHCYMRKYAPRYGYTDGGEEMIILFTTKLNEKKYGSTKNVDLY